jgi:hypothetical protein
MKLEERRKKTYRETDTKDLELIATLIKLSTCGGHVMHTNFREK